MTFTGAPLGLLVGVGALLAAGLVGLYLLRLERRRLEVPFARLWLRVLGQSESVTLHRRLRRPWSLLLMLAVLAALLLALSDPRLAKPRDAKSWVVLMDSSASMQAGDGKITRFAAGKQAVKRFCDGLDSDDEVLLVRVDGRPRPVAPFTRGDALDGPEGLMTELDAMAPGEGKADLPRAMALAQDALRGRANGGVLVVSDGALGCTALDQDGVPRPSDCDLAGDLQSYQIALDQGGGDNVAVTAFSARRYRANRSAYEVLVQVQSYCTTPQTVTLTLKDSDGADDGDTIESTTLTLAPLERRQQRYRQLTGSGTHLTARVTRTVAGAPSPDALPLDDVAYATLPPRQKLRVLLVSEGNLFLEGALLLDENVTVERIAKADYPPAKLASYDAVVFDQLVPAQAPTQDALYIDPQPAPGGFTPFTIGATLDNPIITERDEHHPLARWLSWKDLNIRRASRFVLERGDIAVASVLGQPIIAAREHNGHKSVAVGFDLRQSDLPLRMAFPVLVINTLEWFLGGDTSLIASFSTTAPIELPVKNGHGELLVQGPAGEGEGQLRLPIRDGQAELWAPRAGFYQWSAASGTESGAFAVSLASDSESAIAPRPLRAHGAPLPAPPFRSGHRRPLLWPWLVALALLLLYGEWWSYHRRWTV